MHRADSLLKPLVRDLGIEDSVRLLEIKRNWNNLFREPLSRHMTPSLLSRGELLLMVDSPVWLQELNFYREEIIKKLCHYGVGAVRFRLGRASVRVKPKGGSLKPNIKCLTDKERSFVRETVAKISDEGLKNTLGATIEKAIASGKTKIR